MMGGTLYLSAAGHVGSSMAIDRAFLSINPTVDVAGLSTAPFYRLVSYIQGTQPDQGQWI